MASDEADNPTRVSLLIRLRDSQDAAAWNEFQSSYGPMLYQYCRSRGLPHDDAEDIRGDCYEAVVRQMPTFEYDRARGGFKSWLRTIAIRRIIDRLRRRGEMQADSVVLQQLTIDDEAVDDLWEREWRQHHLRICMEYARARVSEQTWQIFNQLMDTSVAEVCQRLQLTDNQVYKARSRVLAMIRDHMKYLGVED